MFSPQSIKNIFLKETPSTQTFAKQFYTTFDPNQITIVVAEKQTAGFGRFQRKWISSLEDIAATFYFQLPSTINHLSSLTQIMSLTLAEILTEKKLFPEIKWPNDVLLSKKKLAGILCETIITSEITHIFLGIGINVNSVHTTIDKPATSLKTETETIHDKKQLLFRLQQLFFRNLNIFLQNGFSSFLKQLNNFLPKENIVLFDGQNFYEGKPFLTDTGALKLKLSSGKSKIFYAGDTSFPNF